MGDTKIEIKNEEIQDDNKPNYLQIIIISGILLIVLIILIVLSLYVKYTQKINTRGQVISATVLEKMSEDGENFVFVPGKTFGRRSTLVRELNRRQQ